MDKLHRLYVTLPSSTRERLIAHADSGALVLEAMVVQGAQKILEGEFNDTDRVAMYVVQGGAAAQRALNAEAKLAAVIAAADKMEKLLLEKHLLDGLEAARDYRVALRMP